jgi:hypothetical protein
MALPGTSYVDCHFHSFHNPTQNVRTGLLDQATGCVHERVQGTDELGPLFFISSF